MHDGLRTREHNKSTIRLACEFRDVSFNFCRIAYGGRDQAHAERWRGSLDCAQVRGPRWICRIKDNRDTADAGYALLDRLQPSSPDRELKIGEARDIAIWTREVCDVAGCDGIRSFTRRAAGLPFPGAPNPGSVLLAMKASP